MDVCEKVASYDSGTNSTVPGKPWSDHVFPTADLDPLELSVPEELFVFLNSSSTVVNCSARGLPTPTVRWTKVTGGKSCPTLSTARSPPLSPILSWPRLPFYLFLP